MLGRASWNDSLMQRYGQTRQATCWYPGPGDLRDRLSPLDLFRALRDSRRAQRPLTLSIEVDDLAGVVQQTRQIACHLGPRQPVVQLRLRPGRLASVRCPNCLRICATVSTSPSTPFAWPRWNWRMPTGRWWACCVRLVSAS